MTPDTPSERVLCLVGPTAVGKTALIAALAAECPIEVISLDSRQIYRGLKIGTAQPTPEELGVCPHHLCDFLPVDQTYDAARYRRDFEAAYRQVRGRGGVPVVVGGAGMYLTAVREGFMPLPDDAGARLPEVRAALEGLGDAEARKMLAEVDPESAERIHPHDRYRTLRALEIYRLAGRPMSEMVAGQQPDPVLGLEFCVYVLQRPVAELDQRIGRRTAAMLAGGWLEETAAMLERYPATAPGLQSIGYPQIVAHLSGEIDLPTCEANIVRLTRQYAKRQRTWFRKKAAQGRGHPEDTRFRGELLESLRR